jgi:hypothetical protein
MEFLSWTREQWDRAAAGVAGAAGAVALIVGWAGASSAVYPAKQLPYLISGGLGGLFLIGITATMWLSADLRDEWRKLDAIEAELARLNRRLDRSPVPGEEHVNGVTDRDNGATR